MLLSQPKDREIKVRALFFPMKYVIPKILKVLIVHPHIYIYKYFIGGPNVQVTIGIPTLEDIAIVLSSIN